MHRREPEGYKKLLVYQKSEQLMEVCFVVTGKFKDLPDKTLVALADQMDRSMRSVKQNIVEGWKRNTTQEYFQFLGYALASLTELIEDIDDIIKGRYPRIMGIKGIMGEKGISFEEADKLPFYPLPPLLPLILQLKLRAKELSYLLYRLEQSLDQKMTQEGTLPMRTKLAQRKFEQNEADKWLNDQLNKN